MASNQAMEFNDSDIKEDIARRVGFWRKQAELSKSELARRVGKSRGDIGRWESGDVTPGIASVFRLASACGVSLAIFLTADLPD